jgi:hypothetical protein
MSPPAALRRRDAGSKAPRRRARWPQVQKVSAKGNTMTPDGVEAGICHATAIAYCDPLGAIRGHAPAVSVRICNTLERAIGADE